ncbi:MAG: response regulator, partial [Gemmatimonadota bacterium]|nr:response regulator [Gemmatimonadota bacterium]
MRILIVEDSPTQAARLAYHLDEAGHSVVAASSAEDALVQLAAEPVDMVVTDVVMPGMNGYDLCREVKRRRPGTPVMLVTGLSDVIDIIQALEAGADNFVTKPYDPAELLDRIAALVRNREARSQSGPGDGVRVVFREREYAVTSGRGQILDLLVT